MGITPFSAPIRGGGHRVAVELDGQRDERDVALEYGEPETVELTLRGVVSRPTPPVAPTGVQGLLVVRGKPEGALITVDDMPAGTVPMSIPVAEGQHTIRVTSYGYSNYETTAYVAKGAEATVDVNMSKGLGGLGTVDGQPRVIQLGYLLGFSAGADLRGNGGIVLGEFGFRVGQGDASIRVGKAIGYTSVDFIVRWALLKTRIAPFLGGGYSYVKSSSDSSGSSSDSGGAGWEAIGGLRFDLTRGMGTTFSLLGETGFRWYSSISTSSGDKSGVFIPFMATIQVTFGRAR
ncbi:MAG: PEGA domain-containing protein [Myxococcales bacterium]|nr:PEGA domain-containing protein [Myxococcales bacterium]